MPSRIPVHINPYDCAKRGAIFKGNIKVNQFKRLHEFIHGYDEDSEFEVELQFDVDQARDSRLTGLIKGNVILDCQRCLHDVGYAFEITLNHVLCADIAALDRHKKSDTIFSEEDEKVRVVDLIEDEIFLEIPAIPKHQKIEDCQGLDAYLSEDDEPNEKVEERPNPFAILKDKHH